MLDSASGFFFPLPFQLFLHLFFSPFWGLILLKFYIGASLRFFFRWRGSYTPAIPTHSDLRQPCVGGTDAAYPLLPWPCLRVCSPPGPLQLEKAFPRCDAIPLHQPALPPVVKLQGLLPCFLPVLSSCWLGDVCVWGCSCHLKWKNSVLGLAENILKAKVK